MKAIERVYQFIDFKGVKAVPFEKQIGLSNGYLGKQLSRNADLGEGVLIKIIENCPEINPEWLLTGKKPMLKNLNSVTDVNLSTEPTKVYKLKTDIIKEKQMVPLYDIQASASIVSLFRDTSHQKPIDHISIPNLPKCDGAIYVSGDSMYPLLKSGDIIMYKKLSPCLDNIFWGEMYLVSLTNDDGEEFVMVKWVQKSDNGDDYIKLVSENRHHQSKDFHLKNVKGLALIKASVRINSMY